MEHTDLTNYKDLIKQSNLSEKELIEMLPKIKKEAEQIDALNPAQMSDFLKWLPKQEVSKNYDLKFLLNKYGGDTNVIGKKLYQKTHYDVTSNIEEKDNERKKNESQKEIAKSAQFNLN